MMREILFRGKRFMDGQWVDGSLFIDEKKDKHEILVGYVNYRIGWEVDPNTIGQYTGMTDKNGTKIFEGDIIHELDGSMDNIARVVRWDIDYMEYTCPLVKKHWCYGYNECSLWMMHSENIEVVGNIHDNPELMGGNDGED